MGCDPLAVTRFVDGELPQSLGATIGRHLGTCPICAGQAAFEIEVGGILRSLPSLAPPSGLAAKVRAVSRMVSVGAN